MNKLKSYIFFSNVDGTECEIVFTENIQQAFDLFGYTREEVEVEEEEYPPIDAKEWDKISDIYCWNEPLFDKFQSKDEDFLEELLAEYLKLKFEKKEIYKIFDDGAILFKEQYEN